jgi:ABC-type uncharacterized transport system ATPase subunit
LDEPYAFLDDDWGRVVSLSITEATDAGAAVALCSHSAPEGLKSLGDRLEVVRLKSAPVVI